MPIASLVPVLIVWFGFGITTTVVVVFLFAIFEPLIAAEAAVRNVDRGYVDVARTFGARRDPDSRARWCSLRRCRSFFRHPAWQPAGP